MTQEIRYAGVDAALQNKLRQAAPILTMHSVSLHAEGIAVDEWDGQPCDLLVAQARDQAGHAAMADALGQGIPVIAIDQEREVEEADFNLSPDSSTATITRTLKMALTTIA